MFLKACEVKGMKQCLVTTYKSFTYTPIYIIISRSRNRMKFVITLITYSLETSCSNKFLHSSED